MPPKPFVVPLIALCLALGGVSAWAQQKGLIELKSVVEIEVQAVDAQGRTITRRVPAAKVVPGDTVIYTNTYTHVGSEPVSGVVVTNPIPAHMRYLVDSAEGAGMQVTFSIDDGHTYDAPDRLTVVAADGKTRPADPAEYTHIRWTRPSVLNPGESGTVVFKARLE